MKFIYENEKLSKCNWFNLGGPAKILFKLQSVDELKEFLKNNKNENDKFHILGAGSNTLFRDGGFDGVVIKLGNKFSFTKLLNEERQLARILSIQTSLHPFSS